MQRHIQQINQPAPLLKQVTENNSMPVRLKNHPFPWGMMHHPKIQEVVLSGLYIILGQAFRNRPTFCNVDMASSGEATSKD